MICSGAGVSRVVMGENVVSPTTLLDFDIPAGYTKVDVIADMEFHWCAGDCPQIYAKARFALTVTTSGGTNCSSAPVAQTDEYVQRTVNHAAVPLDEPNHTSAMTHMFALPNMSVAR